MRWRQLLATALISALAGGAATAAGVAHTIEKLRLARDVAVHELMAVRQELERATDMPQTGLARVGGIDILVDHPEPRVYHEIERRLMKQVQPLQGRPIAGIDPLTLYGSINGQLLQIDGTMYRLRLLGAVVLTRLFLHVQAEELPAGIN